MAQEDITRSVKDVGGKFNFGDIVPGVSAFTKIASSVYGGIMAKRAAEETKQKLDKMKRENDNEDRRVSYRDPSQSIIAQYALRRTFDAIRDRNRQAAGTAAVMGGTPGVAVEKAANAEQGAETAARVAASEAARQDQLRQQHVARKQQLEQEEYNLIQQKRQNIANAVQNGLGIAGSMAQG